jgi:DNA primase
MNVEDLLHKNNIYYKPAGKDVLVSCLSPDHPDRNPSMRIDKLSGLFNCLSCSFKGNLFTHFNESVDVTSLEIGKIKAKINSILTNDNVLPLGREPFRREFRGIKAETFTEFGAFTHDDFEGRIVFPIQDITGKICGLMGRYAFSTATPKYLIYPSGSDLPIYPPKPLLYKDSVIIVEGIFDMLNLWDKGITNVVCGFGKQLGDVKNKRKREVNLSKFIPLKIQGCKKIYVLFDTGAEKSAHKLADLLNYLFVTEVVEHPMFTADKDPGNMTYSEVQTLKDHIYESSNS